MDNDNNKFDTLDDATSLPQEEVSFDLPETYEDSQFASDEDRFPLDKDVEEPIVVENKIVEENKDNGPSLKKGKKSKKKKFNYWPFIVTILAFCLSLLFSFLSNLITKTTNIPYLDIIIATVLLCVLIIISIIFDGIGVSVTSCTLAPLNAMAARKVPHAKVAIMLVKNAGRVNNICADVIGDICGIVSGACGASLVLSILKLAGDGNQFVISILVSAVIAALTIGGKAFEKTIAINKSQQLVMLTARVIGIFYRPDRKRKKNVRKDK